MAKQLLGGCGSSKAFFYSALDFDLKRLTYQAGDVSKNKNLALIIQRRRFKEERMLEVDKAFKGRSGGAKGH